jgi:signal transduction histidine kinase
MNDKHDLNRLTLRFADPELERRFLEAHRDGTEITTRRVFGIGALVWTLFPIWDYFVVPEIQSQMFFWRIVVALPFLVGEVLLTFLPRQLFHRIWEPSVAAVALVASLAVLGMQADTGIVIAPYVYVGLIVMCLFTHGVTMLRFHWASASTLTVFAGYVILLMVQPMPPKLTINGITWLAAANMFAMISSYQLELLRRKAWMQARIIDQKRALSEQLVLNVQEKSAQLEVANKHKSDFLANMSHELRTPLNAIIGFSEALSDRMFGEINQKQAEYLNDIHESGKHLLSLINDILDLSKIEAGRMDLEISSFHLPSALANAMTLIRERAHRHGIQLGLEVDERLGEFDADERKFKQIMLNLLSNAVKFTPDGGRVDVSAKKFDGKVEVAVRDTGIGIAPEDQAAVFEEFKQVGRDELRKAEGTGLGLALTKRFVELHGGAIRLESTPGKGSTFTVSLPIRH